MEEWKEYVLSELIDEISMGPFGSNIKVECFTDSGVPVLNGGNLVGLKLNEDKFNYVTEKKAASLGKANAYRNDIVITHRGTLGQIVYIPQNSKYDHYVISQSQFRIRCNQKVLPEYLVYYFHTRIGQHQLLSNASQVGVPALARPTTTFQKLRVVLPPLPTQQKIATILSSLDDKIELNNKINTNLERQAGALFKNWFVDFEPFGGKMPEGWKEIALEELCTVVTKGTTPTTLGKKFTETGINFIKGESILENHTFDIQKISHIDEETNTMLKRSIIEPNDILFTIAGTLGRFAMIDKSLTPANTNQAVGIIRANPEIVSPYYLYSFFIGNWHNDYYTKRIQQAVQANLSLGTIKSLPIIIPDSQNLNKYTSLIEPLFKQMKQLENENIKLSTLRDTLLPKLMNEEIFTK